MSVQDRLNITTVPFIRNGDSFVKEAETILQDAGRSVVLVPFTVMAKVAATQKWVPLTSLTTTTGASVAQGVYMGDEIAAADLVAGDVVDSPILVGGSCLVDDGQIILDEGTLTLDDVFSSSDATNVYEVITVRDQLARRGIFVESTVDIDSFENT